MCVYAHVYIHTLQTPIHTHTHACIHNSGLSLHDSSRHRPDLVLNDALKSLDRFKDPRLGALMIFADECAQQIVEDVSMYVCMCVCACVRARVCM